MTDLNLTVTRGDAGMLYLTSAGSYTVRVHLKLDERIREDALRIALDRTAQRYPYFCVTVKKNAKEIYYEENHEPAALLHYDEHISKLPLDKQGTAFRGKTMLQSEETAVRKIMTVIGTRAQTILDSPDLQTKFLAARDALIGSFQGASYMVSYVGKWKYEQLEKHIKELWAYTPAGLFPVIEISSANGRVFLSIMQPFEEDIYCDAFIEELKDHNISYTDHGKEPTCISDLVYQTDATP